jgi:Uncharacterized protein conserved in bacteria
MTLTNNTFIGEYAYALEFKGRVNIPSQNSDRPYPRINKITFVITRGMDSCIWVYPLKQWQIIETDLKNFSSFIKIHKKFGTNKARYASPSTYEKAGTEHLFLPSLI